eukprot:757490-Hanusia_phi.AAC.8
MAMRRRGTAAPLLLLRPLLALLPVLFLTNCFFEPLGVYAFFSSPTCKQASSSWMPKFCCCSASMIYLLPSTRLCALCDRDVDRFLPTSCLRGHITPVQETGLVDQLESYVGDGTSLASSMYRQRFPLLRFLRTANPSQPRNLESSSHSRSQLSLVFFLALSCLQVSCGSRHTCGIGTKTPITACLGGIYDARICSNDAALISANAVSFQTCKVGKGQVRFRVSVSPLPHLHTRRHTVREQNSASERPAVRTNTR